MTERDADQSAEMRERAGRGRGGTAASTGRVRQTGTARVEVSITETSRLMEEVLRRENLIRAHARVVGNGGAPGVDGMTVDALMPYCREHWARIREALLSATYVPHPVRRVDIPKLGGTGTRTLGIPTVLDRLIQQALLQVLQPLVDPTFSDDSFGFRPGRSAHDAIRRARDHIATGRRWVVDMDLEKFFDRVNHDVLMARVARRVKDRRVLRLIRRYLQAGMMTDGLTSPAASTNSTRGFAVDCAAFCGVSGSDHAREPPNCDGADWTRRVPVSLPITGGVRGGTRARVTCTQPYPRRCFADGDS